MMTRFGKSPIDIKIHMLWFLLCYFFLVYFYSNNWSKTKCNQWYITYTMMPSIMEISSSLWCLYQPHPVCADPITHLYLPHPLCAWSDNRSIPKTSFTFLIQWKIFTYYILYKPGQITDLYLPELALEPITDK